MEFIFDTNYDQKAFTAMYKVLRKTVRKARFCFTYIILSCFAIAVVLGILFPFVVFHDYEESTLSTLLVIVPITVFIIVLMLSAIALPVIFQDVVGGAFERTRMLPGTEGATAVFTMESYTITTAALKTEYRYNNIILITETKDYFVFVLGKDYAQVFSKNSISNGTTEDFHRFIEEKTCKKMVSIA